MKDTVLGPPFCSEDGWVAGNRGQLELTPQEAVIRRARRCEAYPPGSGGWLTLDEKGLLWWLLPLLEVQCPFPSIVQDLRRKAARLVAAKCTLAARVDSFHESTEGKVRGRQASVPGAGGLSMGRCYFRELSRLAHDAFVCNPD